MFMRGQPENVEWKNPRLSLDSILAGGISHVRVHFPRLQGPWMRNDVVVPLRPCDRFLQGGGGEKVGVL